MRRSVKKKNAEATREIGQFFGVGAAAGGVKLTRREKEGKKGRKKKEEKEKREERREKKEEMRERLNP